MRNDILNFIRKELIGPDPVQPHVQANGEEILINEPPRLRYGAGILFPCTVPYLRADSNTQVEQDLISADETIPDGIESPVTLGDSHAPTDMGEDFEEEIGLANSYLPAAMGISCFIEVPQEGFIITFTAARYEVRDYSFQTEDGHLLSRRCYFRVPLDQSLIIKANELPLDTGSDCDFFLKESDGSDLALRLNIRNRTHGSDRPNLHLLTFTLINQNNSSQENIRNEDCFFQTGFTVSATAPCFHPYKTAVSEADTDDERSNQLLFRNIHTFAVGHGCSPAWNDEDSPVINELKTTVLPSYEIKPVLPASLPGVTLEMDELSDLSESDLSVPLNRLTESYDKWISQQEEIAETTLDGDLLITALRHIDNCRDCLHRMQEGITLLSTNDKAEKAFRLMNRAMLLQQLRYAVPIRMWPLDSRSNINPLPDMELPDVKNRSTWPNGLGSWRPFQLAFILMNLQCMLEPDHIDREMVDLIWFPTGGGKTEAYLGLSAYTIFVRRLRDQNDNGTSVLMRYTLRLLTAQQFQRAASLICACETIRQENTQQLGRERITIGLWVGESLTPIYRSDAVSSFTKMEQGREDQNPFIVLKCPWCAAQMGYIKESKANRIKGYKLQNVSGKKTVVYRCDNPNCEFSAPSNNLPLIVIDEDIYQHPPTLIIGTVDKFAMLTWRPDARSLFGFTDTGHRNSPPELIIQDELHLISGPLGSMVGLFETMVEELCTINGIKPKIIASSATISRAREQINALYGRGTHNVTIFPPQCLNAGDSFFAKEDRSVPGRLYTGIFASALPSHATAQVRVISAQLQAVRSVPAKEEIQRDPYWTSLIYFNSIRELGHAATLIRADITEYMNSIWKRKLIRGDERRFINRDIELTSRMESSDIPEYLEQLYVQWDGARNTWPVDVCLATNMISVGVDIPRLGLMTVIGQPKTTSEYIQATSRVGRGRNMPGLVFTIYNCSKPRDRSHFEQFQSYHARIYSKVEPTSVTPFSTPARERALHSILVGLIRYYGAYSLDSPNPYPEPNVIERVQEIITNRVGLIDEAELESTVRMLEEKLTYWRNEMPMDYGGFRLGPNTPLLYPAGSNPPEQIRDRAWSTPTSMRNVDSTCEATIIREYHNIDDR
ncbi:helicase-related protein [Spirosoma agri]|uniref:Helicase C-terminal domain-containing protein n=1 Tax=Spirosoma agri TaxID=1987381 RepID=A0A6M0IRF9_9BACT|nr:helicase-related protein [Spirosoma agri]NEU70572.1 hypothetical protein [Spirosoma agri]